MNYARWSQLHLDRYGVCVSLIVGDRTWTNAELHDAASRVASALIAREISPGDRVVLMLPSDHDALVASTATWLAGGVVVFVDPAASTHELARVIAACAPTTVVVVDARAADAVEVIDENRVVRASELPALIASHAPLVDPVARDPSDPAQLAFSSGTTGTPKATIFTHQSLDAFQAAHLDQHECALVLFPPTAFAGGLLRRRWMGRNQLVVLPRFEPRAAVEAIERHGVTSLRLVPAMAEALLAYTDGPLASSLRLLSVGGAHMSPRLAEALERVLGIRPINTYGMTEAGGVIASDKGCTRPGAIGRAASGVEIRIVDADERPVEAGREGEIYVRTPWRTAGYWGAPAETAATFRDDGWIRTGDRGHLDADGILTLSGRSKEVIIQGGFNVAPEEVNEVVRSLPGVAECAVVGVPHDMLGELVVAAVVRRPGAEVSERDVLEWCRTQLDLRKLPGRAVFVDQVPRTATGKVASAALLREVMARLASEAADTSRAEVSLDTVATLWRELLDVELDPDTDFFASGGDSLLAIRLLARIEQTFGARVPLQRLFSRSRLGELVEDTKAEQARGDRPASRPVLEPRGVLRTPVLAPQRGAYKLDRYAPANSGTRFKHSELLEGPVDAHTLEQALGAMRDRHSILRTRFFEENGEIWQEVLARVDAPLLDRVDLSALPPAEQERASSALHERLFTRPFDLERGEVMRAVLVSYSVTSHRLSYLLHRVVCDLQSLVIFDDELHVLWRSFTTDPARAAMALPPVRLQYADLAAHLTELASSEFGQVQAAYWREALAGAVPLELPTDLPRDAVDAERAARSGFATFPAHTTTGVIDSDTLASVERIARDERVSMQAVLLGAMAGYLREQTSQHDLSIVGHLLFRHIPGLERMIGMFTNPLVLRLEATSSDFRPLVRSAHQRLTTAFEHGEFDVLGLAPHLFRLWFNYLYDDAAPLASAEPLPGVVRTPTEFPGDYAFEMAYDLLLWVTRHRDHVAFRLAYNTSLFIETGAVAFLAGYIDHIRRVVRS